MKRQIQEGLGRRRQADEDFYEEVKANHDSVMRLRFNPDMEEDFLERERHEIREQLKARSRSWNAPAHEMSWQSASVSQSQPQASPQAPAPAPAAPSPDAVAPSPTATAPSPPPDPDHTA